MSAVEGRGRDRLVHADGGTGAWGPWRSNLVTWSAADLIGGLLTRRPGFGGLLHLAVGAGDEAWDTTAPTPDPARTALTAEVARVGLRPEDHLTFDRDTSTVRVAVTLPAGLATGTLREVGLFGGDGEILVNHRVHPRIDKAEGDRLEREVQLVLGDPLGPGARLLVGAMLAGWADGTGLTHVGLGRDGGAVARPESLRAERTRLPLSRRALRYLPRDHAVEVLVELGPGDGPDRLAEIGVFGGPATANPDTGWLFARDTFPAVDRTGARRFRRRLRLTLVAETGLVVPEVTQGSLAQARTALRQAKLQVGTITWDETETTPADRVTVQQPVAGESVAEATPVDLTVTIRPRVTVPNAVGLPRAAVVTGLTALGLVVNDPVVEQIDAVVAPDTVLALEPEPGTRVPKGTAVTLTVAVGPRVVLPDVRGRALPAARQALEMAGLVVAGTITEAESEATPGSVVESDPVPGTDVARGSSVSLVLAVPRTVAVPGLVGLDVDAARAALATAGAPLLPTGSTFPAGLDLGDRREQEVPRGDTTGVVLVQDPDEGARLPRYATVDVVVAIAASVAVPDLRQGDLAAAGAGLTAIGLKLSRVQSRRSDASPGQVVAQVPAAGASARVGDGVAVWVAAGALATVPPVTGLTLDAAREALTMVGLTLQVTAQQPGGERPGEVLGQDPRPGRVVPVGSAVGVTVAAGVPDLVGLTVEAAKAAAAAVNLTLRQTTRESDGPEGLVLEQEPRPGSPVGRQVTVVVSVPVTVEVPDVGGLAPDAASVQLASRQLEMSVRGRPVDADKAGTIVAQDPAAGTRAPVGSTVHVDVAQRPVATVRVPDLRTRPIDEARAVLQDVGLVEGRLTEQPSWEHAGTVVAQDPAPGIVVAAGTAVALVVGVAGGLVDVPDVRGLPSAEANRVLGRSGLQYAVGGRRPSEQPLDTVLAQDPGPGATVPVGSTVSVVLATDFGVRVPGVAGRTREAAMAALLRLGLVVDEHLVKSIRPPGTVVGQDPRADTVVPPGSTITIGIATRGPDVFDPFERPPIIRPPIIRPPG